jgi:CelD/BcsL family acetyltransferase involved in cellulose biosynthesis
MASRRTELVTMVQTSSQNLRVVETDPQTDPRWESFVVGHPNGSIYHHPAWLEALEREYSQKGVYFVCEDAAGQVLAILPMLYTRGLPFSVGNPLAGRRLSSLPRTPIAGPLSIDSRATVALLQEAVQRVSQNPGIQLQIKNQGRELEGLIDGLVCTPWRLAYLLRLPTNSEGPFRINNSENRASVKRAINKAKRLGVYARPAETEAELRTWYRLYLETMRRNLVPPRPYRFFAALWKLLKPRGMMQLLLAEQESKGQRRIIAGSIFLLFGRTVSYGFNGSALKDLSLRPNDLLHWQAINEACTSGFRFLDLGEVPEGDDDLARFKRKWGAEPVRLHRYCYPGSRDLDGVSVESGGYPQLISRALWCRLPLAATAWLGDRIYAYL